jgi:HK97 family phage prohead protease
VIDGADGKRKIVGYAAVFNARSANLGGFREEIAPGAFTDALAANEEVLALVEHSPEKILGRRSMGTLTLAQDDKGLRVEIDPPNTTVGNDAVENVRAATSRA